MVVRKNQFRIGSPAGWEKTCYDERTGEGTLNPRGGGAAEPQRTEELAEDEEDGGGGGRWGPTS